MNLIKTLLIIAGFIFVGLGILGMFLPVLPTTPFLLLAAACFGKSSPRFYCWLLNNKWFGSYIKNYRLGLGIPLRIKIFSISFLWITILSSAIFFIDNIYVKILLIGIAIAVTTHISMVKTKRRTSISENIKERGDS